MNDVSQGGGAGQTTGFEPGQIAGRLLETLGPSVVSGILQQFNASGFGAQVNSWLGRGPNEPLTVQQVYDALGNQKVQEIARSLGIPTDRVAEILAKSLPKAVDEASPDGALTTKA